MRRSFLELLVDPVHHGPLVLEAGDGVGDVIDGILRAIDGSAYPIRGGLPRFVVTEDEGQLQTLDAFSFKWSREESYSWMRRTGSSAPYESWLWEKYGFKSDQEWREHYCSCRQILDLGCGAGMASWSWLTSDRWDGSAAWSIHRVMLSWREEQALASHHESVVFDDFGVAAGIEVAA